MIYWTLFFGLLQIYHIASMAPDPLSWVHLYGDAQVDVDTSLTTPGSVMGHTIGIHDQMLYTYGGHIYSSGTKGIIYNTNDSLHSI